MPETGDKDFVKSIDSAIEKMDKQLENLDEDVVVEDEVKKSHSFGLLDSASDESIQDLLDIEPIFKSFAETNDKNHNRIARALEALTAIVVESANINKSLNEKIVSLEEQVALIANTPKDRKAALSKSEAETLSQNIEEKIEKSDDVILEPKEDNSVNILSKPLYMLRNEISKSLKDEITKGNLDAMEIVNFQSIPGDVSLHDVLENEVSKEVATVINTVVEDAKKHIK